jgi:hypothetical protein
MAVAGRHAPEGRVRVPVAAAICKTSGGDTHIIFFINFLK